MENKLLTANKTEMTSEKLLILVSGGRSSAMMARHIQQSPKYDHFEKLYVFCNTGQERPETIQFLKDMVFHWGIPLNIIEGVYSVVAGIGVSSKGVDFDTLSMDGRPYAEAIAHMNKLKWTGVPNPATPYCSEYLKVRPSLHFAKTVFGTTKYLKAVGYRREDMPKRITMAELREDKKRLAPLLTDFESPIGLEQLTRYFAIQPFRLGISSRLGNCELCWKKSDRNLVDAIQYGTRFIDWHREMETQYQNSFFRNNLKIDDLVRIAESGIQTKMFDEVSGDQCVCSF